MKRLIFINHALRDLRGSLRHFRLLFVCLCLGVAVMACIGSSINGIKAGIERDAKAMLGGDIEIRQIYGPIPDEVIAYITFNGGKYARSMDMRAMAEGKGDNIDKQVLVEVKGVDPSYPLYGKLDLDTKKKNVSEVLFSNWRAQVHGAAVDQGLLDSLNIKLGDKFKIGDSTFNATALIQHEPDRSVSSFSLGPRVLVNNAAFKSTGLVKNTSLVNYRYRIELPPGVNSTQWKQKIQAAFPGAFWNIQDWRDSASSIGKQIDRLSLFFVFTAMTTLIVAGIGISNATSAYMWGKRGIIAALKCIGASQGHVYRMYLTQLLIVATVAIAYGVLIGLGASVLLMHFLDGMLPVRSEYALYPQPMLLSAGLGYLTVLMFGLIPLRQTHNIRPSALFRGYVDSTAASRPLTLSSLLLAPVYSVLACGMLALSIEFTHTVRIPLYFAAGLIFSLTLLYLISLGIRSVAKKISVRADWSFTTRMALSNLARPGSATTSVVIALGVGMSVLTALSLVSSNMREQLDRSLPEHAPAFFLLDIQPSTLEKLTANLKAQPGVGNIRSLPLIRGRITKLNGVLSEKVTVRDDVRWALDGTRGITFAATPPEHSNITQGTWWAADYKGPPLVSLDANLARGMGLKIGDSITVAAIDKEITGTIANVRDIPWGSLEMNFTTVFSPGSLDQLPITYLATLTAPPEREKAITNMLAKEHPGVAVIRVRSALSNISDFIREMSRAIYLTASVTILCGTLVMASAIHATLFKRKFDTVMMKVIGLTRKQIMAIYLREFALVSLAAAVVATFIGTLSAYGIMQLLVFTQFRVMPGVIATTIFGSIAVALLLGLAATRIALRVKPLSLLRNQ